MSMNQTVQFVFDYIGDGSTTELVVDLNLGPAQFLVNGSIGVITPIAKAASGIFNLNVGGASVSSFTFSKGILTIEFASAPSSGLHSDNTGYLLF